VVLSQGLNLASILYGIMGTAIVSYKLIRLKFIGAYNNAEDNREFYSTENNTITFLKTRAYTVWGICMLLLAYVLQFLNWIFGVIGMTSILINGLAFMLVVISFSIGSFLIMILILDSEREQIKKLNEKNHIHNII
jgi:hypothetical protein